MLHCGLIVESWYLPEDFRAHKVILIHLSYNDLLAQLCVF